MYVIHSGAARTGRNPVDESGQPCDYQTCAYIDAVLNHAPNLSKGVGKIVEE